VNFVKIVKVKVKVKLKSIGTIGFLDPQNPTLDTKIKFLRRIPKKLCSKMQNHVMADAVKVKVKDQSHWFILSMMENEET
jgi:hypothetical protein